MKWFSNLTITTKIVCMVLLLGALAVVITLYSLRSLYMVDRDYRSLLDKEAQATMLLGDASLELSHGSRLVFAVLTEQESKKMHQIQEVLNVHQTRFIELIQQVRPLLPHRTVELDRLLEQQFRVFAQAGEVVTWAARWRGDRALNIIYQQYEPSLNLLRKNMRQLHMDTVDHYQQNSAELNATTQLTLINTAIAFGVALCTVIGLAAALSLHYVSRPISQLTHVMGRLTQRDYPDRIDYTDRKDEVGQMAQALEVFMDNMRRAEQLEIAEQTAKAKAIFLASMNHEIRTPMNAILGLTRLSLKHPLPESQRERITKIEVAGQHLLEIINSILDFSKMDADHLTLEQIVFDPEQLLQEVNDILEGRAKEKGLSLHYRLASPLPPLLGDPLRISQMLLNYINNAIKYSDRGHIHIVLRVEPIDDQHVWLYGEVIDQGLGIRDQDQDRVFSPFEQAESSTSRNFEGTGLGLSITRHLAQLMGGEVGLRSSFGLGSTFWFRVQMQLAGENSVISLKPGAIDLSALRGRRALLVDDLEVNLLVASELLQEVGLQVETATSGEAALDLLARQASDYYDWVLLDLMMPGLDGLETCRRIRAQARFTSLPVIAVSANSSPLDLLQCREAGMSGHVAKPLQEQQLWQSLSTCLLADVIPTPDVNPTVDSLSSRSTAKVVLQQILDERCLSLLQQRLPAKRFNRLLSMLLADSQKWRNILVVQLVDKQTEVLRQLAHDIVGPAGHAGMSRLLAHANFITQALQTADEDQAWLLAVKMITLIDETVEQLDAYFDLRQAQKEASS